MGLVRRPGTIIQPGNGLLLGDWFQISYATNDIDRACAGFTDRLGIRDFGRMDGEFPQGGKVRIRMAWVGNIMYEIIESTGAGGEVYSEVLPRHGYAIRQHHLGYFIRDDAEWDALHGEISRNAWKIRLQSDTPGFLRVVYLEIPEMGHLLEFIQLEPPAVALFENVPAS